MAIENKENYIVQEQLEGNIFTVDYCRCANTGIDAAIPRQELLRTKNGAGLTIQTSSDNSLIKLVSYIGNKININGCVNLEFILNNGKYYLIDINPRFSAGVAFSVVSGYDMVVNHIRCFTNEDIDRQIAITPKIIIKKYQEIIY
jgi:carbamoyl-phosphate synthase large subunit